jgi:aspartokinase
MKNTGSIANLVRLYLKRRPILLSMVRGGLCNYSELAHKISKSIGAGGKTDAVKAAIIRAGKMQHRVPEDYEARVEALLKQSSIEVRSKVAVVRSQSAIRVPVIAVSNSRSGVMSVVDSSYVPALKKKNLHVIDNLVLITVYSPKEIENIPGSVATMLDALWAEGINMLEIISCHNDTLLLLRNSDSTRAYEVLSEMMELKKK